MPRKPRKWAVEFRNGDDQRWFTVKILDDPGSAEALKSNTIKTNKKKQGVEVRVREISEESICRPANIGRR